MFRSLCGAALLVCSGAAFAQGSFDFSHIPGLTGEAKVQINLNPAMLGFITAAAESSDPETAQALQGVHGVQVYVYEIGSANRPLLDFVESTSKTLEQEGWQRMVYVQDKSDKVRMYVKSDDAKVLGLTMMVVSEDGEAVFINVDGDLDPATLGRLVGSLGVGDVIGEAAGKTSPAANQAAQ
jgi:hypothetical protein